MRKSIKFPSGSLCQKTYMLIRNGGKKHTPNDGVAVVASGWGGTHRFVLRDDLHRGLRWACRRRVGGRGRRRRTTFGLHLVAVHPANTTTRVYTQTAGLGEICAFAWKLVFKCALMGAQLFLLPSGSARRLLTRAFACPADRERGRRVIIG